jgi:acetyl esterase/lipase
LYLHGGGYTVGSLNSHNGFMAYLAVACNARVIGLDYRLAPEHPYPAALDDAVAAFTGMTKSIAAGKTMIAGDSAGGGLALACVLRLKDEGLPLPGCAALLSPLTDLTCSGESLGSYRDQFAKGAAAYVGDHQPDTIGISPLFGDMAGLPPLLLQVVSDESLLDDSVRLEKRARDAGVSVDIRLFDDAFHVFQIFTEFPESQDALSDLGRFYKLHIR